MLVNEQDVVNVYVYATILVQHNVRAVYIVNNIPLYTLSYPWHFMPALLTMGYQVCQKYLQMLYLYISLWYIAKYDIDLSKYLATWFIAICGLDIIAISDLYGPECIYLCHIYKHGSDLYIWTNLSQIYKSGTLQKGVVYM